MCGRMLRNVLVAMVLVSALCSTVARGETGPSGTDKKAVLKVISEGYKHNRASFPLVDCEFVVSRGVAPSADKAFTAPLAEVEEATGVWVVNDDLVRYEQMARNPPTIVKVVDERHVRWRSPFLQNKSLRSRDFGLRWTPLLNAGELFSPEYPGELAMETPFDFVGLTLTPEALTPATILDQYLEGGTTKPAQAYVEETRTDNTRGIYSVRCSQSDGSIEYRIDSNRGFLPVDTTVTAEDGTRVRIVFLEIREFPGQRYFPVRSRKCTFWRKYAGGPLQVTEMRVTRLKVDEPPPPDRFCIEVGEGALLHHSHTDNSQFPVQTQRISVDMLPRLVETALAQTRAALPNREPLTPAPPDQRLLIGLLPVALIVLFILLGRKGRKGERGTGALIDTTRGAG